MRWLTRLLNREPKPAKPEPHYQPECETCQMGYVTLCSDYRRENGLPELPPGLHTPESVKLYDQR